MTEPYISEQVQEYWINEGERTTIITIHAFGREFVAHYPCTLDPIDVVAVDHDGEVYVASCGQRPVADSGAWYMGDESILIGKIDPDDWETMCAYIEEKDGVYQVAPWPSDFTQTLS